MFILPAIVAIVRDLKMDKAECVLQGDVEGTIVFKQADALGPVKVIGRVSGLQEGLYGLHIYEVGDNTNDCTSAGPDIDPLAKDHSAPDAAVCLVKDLGNFKAGDDGYANINLMVKVIQLQGPKNIINKTLVVHADHDDFGEIPFTQTETPGARLTCDIVSIAEAKIRRLSCDSYKTTNLLE